MSAAKSLSTKSRNGFRWSIIAWTEDRLTGFVMALYTLILMVLLNHFLWWVSNVSTLPLGFCWVRKIYFKGLKEGKRRVFHHYSACFNSLISLSAAVDFSWGSWMKSLRCYFGFHITCLKPEEKDVFGWDGCQVSCRSICLLPYLLTAVFFESQSCLGANVMSELPAKD